MRFYQIDIWYTDEKYNRTKRYYPQSMEKLGLKKWSYSSVDDSGAVLTSALDLYVDIQNYQLGEARKGSMVRLSGISLADISQWNDLASAEIEVHAGMLDGYLPLAKAAKPDLLMRGTVWWANGNWEGVNTTLDLIVVPVIGLDPKLLKEETKNLVFSWDIGQQLSEAIRKALAPAYGKSTENPNGYDIKIKISDQLVAQKSAITGSAYYNLSDFGRELNKITKADFPSIKPLNGSPKYTGVEIKVFDRVITVYDGTEYVSEWTKDKPKVIAFQELIGQPGWKHATRLTFKTPMRGDLGVGDWIKLPQFLASPYVITSGGGTQPTNDSAGLKEPSKMATTFQGVFEIVSVRHVGQFRQADAQSWVTVFECEAIPTKKDVKPLDSTPAVPPGGTLGREPYQPREAQGGPLQTSTNNPTNPLGDPSDPANR